MDGTRFDAWTRRRVGLAAGGMTVALLGIAGGDAEAKKKKRRCKKLGDQCKPSGKKKRCCKQLSCELELNNAGLLRCCGKPGLTCGSGPECCSTICQNEQCFCKGLGQPCGIDQHCCSRNCDNTSHCAEPI